MKKFAPLFVRQAGLPVPALLSLSDSAELKDETMIQPRRGEFNSIDRFQVAISYYQRLQAALEDMNYSVPLVKSLSDLKRQIKLEPGGEFWFWLVLRLAATGSIIGACMVRRTYRNNLAVEYQVGPTSAWEMENFEFVRECLFFGLCQIAGHFGCGAISGLHSLAGETAGARFVVARSSR